MIQLATDPNASRSNWRPAAADSRDTAPAPRRPRSGHAWPFIVRHTERVALQDEKRTPSSANGS